MKTVEIYTSPLCGFCFSAKRLLTQKGVSFTEIDVLQDPERRKEMLQRANGRHTVPQIFVGDLHVGGCDDLLAGSHVHAFAAHTADADKCKADLLVSGVSAGHGRGTDQ